MKAHEFCYWLQGWLEMDKPSAMSADQLDVMKKHLEMVFIHDIDPKYAEKERLDAAHGGGELPPHLRPGGNSGPVKLRC